MSTKTAVIPLKQGDTFKKRFTWLQGAEPYNLRFCDGYMQVRDIGTDEVVAMASTEIGNMVINEEFGHIDIWFDSRELEVKPYKSDIKLVFIDGVVMSTPTFIIAVGDGVTDLVNLYNRAFKVQQKSRVIDLKERIYKKKANV
jgi:hypothetical protein